MSEKRLEDRKQRLINEAKGCRDADRLWLIVVQLQLLGDCENAARVEAKRLSLMRDWSMVNR